MGLEHLPSGLHPKFQVKMYSGVRIQRPPLVHDKNTFHQSNRLGSLVISLGWKYRKSTYIRIKFPLILFPLRSSIGIIKGMAKVVEDQSRDANST
jgi:hypothetical protein